MGKKPFGVKETYYRFFTNRLQNAIGNKADSLVLTGIVTAKKLGPCRIVDVCMIPWLMDTMLTAESGLRRSLTGPLMYYNFEGGSLVDRFRQLIEHLSSALAVRIFQDCISLGRGLLQVHA